MCGIVGLLLKKPALRGQLGELMTPMLIGMTERGPDSAGVAVFGEPVDDDSAQVSAVLGRAATADWKRLVAGAARGIRRQASLRADWPPRRADDAGASPKP